MDNFEEKLNMLRDKHHSDSISRSLIDWILRILGSSIICGFCLAISVAILLISSISSWYALVPFILSVVLFFNSIYSLDKYEAIARLKDREYFLDCLNNAKTSEELEKAGLVELKYFELVPRKFSNQLDVT